MKISHLMTVVGVLALTYMAAGSPPKGVAWTVFFEDPATVWAKISYLGEMWLVPAGLAFVAVTLFQLQMRLSLTGAAFGLVWGLGVVGWSLLFHVMSQMGTMSQPFYILGMATGVAVSSQVYAVSMKPSLFGMCLPRVIFRWNQKGVEGVHQRLQAARMAPGQPLGL